MKIRIIQPQEPSLKGLKTFQNDTGETVSRYVWNLALVKVRLGLVPSAQELYKSLSRLAELKTETERKVSHMQDHLLQLQKTMLVLTCNECKLTKGACGCQHCHCQNDQRQYADYACNIPKLQPSIEALRINFANVKLYLWMIENRY